MVELAPGTTIAGYRIVELVNRGGMGVVYRATHVALDRDAALKVIAPEYAADLAFRARFVRESRVAAKVDHPHVIPVYDAGEQDGLLYLAMQFIQGTDLRQELHRCGSLEPERAVKLVSQVASALDAAHRSGLVHRDVKPANVLIAGRDGEEYAYLSDFGLTKHLESHAKETRTGMFVGTTDYIAPEQVMGGPLDRRADVYSLGCVLYHLLSGRVPYPREHDIAAATAHLTEAPPSLAALKPELAEHFDPIIGRAMAKQPADRYASAGEFAAAADRACRARARTRTSPAPAAAVTPAASARAQTRSEQRPAAGWYSEPGTGRKRWWTGTGWGDYEPEEQRAPSRPPQPPGWYPEPGTGRLRLWTGTAWGEYAARDGAGAKPPPPQQQRPRARGVRWWRWAAAVVIGLVVLSAIGGALQKSGTSSSSSSSSSSSAPRSTASASGAPRAPAPVAAQPSLGAQLTAAQLTAVLVPQSAYQTLPDAVSAGGIQADTSAYALQGGLPALKLCNAPIKEPGLGADSASSYEDITVLPGDSYFGSDAASFAGRGAEELLATAGAQASTCGWRTVPGPRLDEQVVRITTDQAGPEGTTLHDDVILVRSGATVLEIGTAVFSGTHSSDAEKLAEQGAPRLAQAEHGGTA